MSFKTCVVGEHSQQRSGIERTHRRLRRDPAGISSDNGGENPPHRKSKVS
jgi:hypothetical protein